MTVVTSALRYSLLYLLAISILTSTSHSEEEDILVDLKDMIADPPRQKISHFRMYWHDIVSGQRPTSVSIVKSTSTNGFGLVNMIDNPLTLGPDVGSKLVGRAQGFYALASQNEIGLLMTMNLVFSYGKYNGSTITVLGRNPVMNKEREMPVIGGTGHFRFARGYVRVRTHWFDQKTGDAIAEYNIHVLHY